METLEQVKHVLSRQDSQGHRESWQKKSLKENNVPFKEPLAGGVLSASSSDFKAERNLLTPLERLGGDMILKTGGG
jgi:hypothetical protein